MDNLYGITELLSFLHSWFDAFFGSIPWEKQSYSTSSIVGNIFSLGQFQVEYKRSNKVIHRRVVLGVICLILIPIFAINKGIWIFVAFMVGLLGINLIYHACNPFAIRCVAVFKGGIAWKKRENISHLTWNQISHIGLFNNGFWVFTNDEKQIYYDKALYDSEFGQSIAIALQEQEEEQFQFKEIKEVSISSSLQKAQEFKRKHDTPIRLQGSGALIGGIVGSLLVALYLYFDINPTIGYAIICAAPFGLILTAPLGIIVAQIFWILLMRIIHLPSNDRIDRIQDVVLSTLSGLATFFMMIVLLLLSIGL